MCVPITSFGDHDWLKKEKTDCCWTLVIADLATGQVPEHWEKHGPDEMVKLVPLAATGSDYKDVEDSFKLTVPNVNITAVSK